MVCGFFWLIFLRINKFLQTNVQFFNFPPPQYLGIQKKQIRPVLRILLHLKTEILAIENRFSRFIRLAWKVNHYVFFIYIFVFFKLDNDIGDEGANHLGAALTKNKSLLHINLSSMLFITIIFFSHIFLSTYIAHISYTFVKHFHIIITYIYYIYIYHISLLHFTSIYNIYLLMYVINNKIFFYREPNMC